MLIVLKVKLYLLYVAKLAPEAWIDTVVNLYSEKL